MLFAGRLCSRVVERLFLVSSNCLDQLRDCDTIKQYCSALNCVSVWQAVQTLQYPSEDSVLLCCCTMMTGKLIQVFWRMQIIHLFKMSVNNKNLKYHIIPQQFNCQQHHQPLWESVISLTFSYLKVCIHENRSFEG
jgi:hypothetical protein